MPEVPRELLVIFEPRLFGAALAAVRSVTTVTQLLEPRLAIVHSHPDTSERLTSIRGVAGVYDSEPPSLPPDFSESERSFAGAWALRQRPKTRIGDGLSWDAPGFQPPDAPSRRRS